MGLLESLNAIMKCFVNGTGSIHVPFLSSVVFVTHTLRSPISATFTLATPLWPILCKCHSILIKLARSFIRFKVLVLLNALRIEAR